MDECGLWSAAAGADKALAARVDGLLDAWQSTRRIVVAVSNEVGSGVVPATASGVRYRDELGLLNTRIAAHCQQVWLCTAGIPGGCGDRGGRPPGERRPAAAPGA